MPHKKRRFSFCFKIGAVGILLTLCVEVTVHLLDKSAHSINRKAFFLHGDVWPWLEGQATDRRAAGLALPRGAESPRSADELAGKDAEVDAGRTVEKKKGVEGGLRQGGTKEGNGERNPPQGRKRRGRAEGGGTRDKDLETHAVLGGGTRGQRGMKEGKQLLNRAARWRERKERSKSRQLVERGGSGGEGGNGALRGRVGRGQGPLAQGQLVHGQLAHGQLAPRAMEALRRARENLARVFSEPSRLRAWSKVDSTLARKRLSRVRELAGNLAARILRKGPPPRGSLPEGRVLSDTAKGEMQSASNPTAGAYGVDYTTWDSAVATAGKFKYVWKRRERLQQLLFFVKRSYLCTTMDRFHFETLEAMRRHPRLNVTLWGPGFKGYKRDLGLTSNIAAKFGCDFFDIVYKFASSTYYNSLEPSCSKRTVVVDVILDCHHVKCIPTFNPRSHVTLLRYAFIPLELFNAKERNLTEGLPLQLIGHSPECALPQNFGPAKFTDRSPVAINIGKKVGWLYPLRTRVQELTETGALGPRFSIWKHPGYRVQRDSCDPLTPSKNYNSMLSKTRICIFDSSIIRKAIRKYVEAMMGGCVIAADLPHEMEEELQPVVVDIEGMSPHMLQHTVENVLDSKQEWESRALAGLRLAHQRLTCYSKVDGILDYVDQYRKGRRGYYFPFGFRLDCHKYAPLPTSYGKVSDGWRFRCYNGSQI